MTAFIRYNTLLMDQIDSKDLSLTGMGVYFGLRARYGLGKADINIFEIAEATHLSEATVRNKFRELAKLGWLVVERKNSRYGRNQYWICLEPFQKESEIEGTVDDPNDDGILRFVEDPDNPVAW